MNQPVTDPPKQLGPRRKRWLRFSFSLRTMFAVVTVFGVWMGWQVKIVRERKEILCTLDKLFPKENNGGYFVLELAEQSPGNAAMFANGGYEYARVSPVRRLIGDKSIFILTLNTDFAPQFIERVENAFPEAELQTWFSERQRFHYRDSLCKPMALRKKNEGTLFKTGKFD